VFASLTLILSVLPGALAPALQQSAGAAPSTPLVRQLGAQSATPRRVARAVERTLLQRNLLDMARHSRRLARFVDRSTHLVKQDVTARCARMGRHGRREHIFRCRIWLQPRPASNGVTVLGRHKRAGWVFRLRPRQRRHRRH
jgi:hypothetical protein